MARILVVDDNQRSRLLLQTYFQMEGHQVTVAEDGGRALELLASANPDVVILDSQMPGMSGMEFLREVRGHGAYDSLPVVFCTGHHDQESEARTAGASAFVTKPYLPADLRDAVLRLIDG